MDYQFSYPGGYTNFRRGISNASAQYDYARALQYSMFLYDANMCGTEVSENSLLSWRDDCHVYDAKLPLDSTNTNMSSGYISRYKNILDPDGDGTVDVAGGFHDAGDHVKFGMPQVYSASTLGWGFYEFREQFEELGQDVHMKRILRYFNDYFMKVTFRDSSGKVVAHCYQVGDGDIDHQYWNAPEDDTMFRRGWFATEELPATDAISGAAASLAINYMNFKDEDPQYAQKVLIMQKLYLILHIQIIKQLLKMELEFITIQLIGKMITVGLQLGFT